MDEILNAKDGYPAWAPSPYAELVETFDFHDMPLSGVIRQNGSRFLFKCLEGHLAPYSLWAYVETNPEELASLAAAPQVVDFDSEIEKALHSGRSVVVAVTREGEGIVYTANLGPIGRYGELVNEALQTLPLPAHVIDALDLSPFLRGN